MAKLEHGSTRDEAALAATLPAGSLPGIFGKLTQEHREAARLLERLRQDGDPDLRRGLFPEVRNKLLAHEEGELMELYTLLRRDPRTRALTERHDRQAGQLRVLVDALSSLEPDDPAWPSRLADVIAELEQHVADEEGQYFPEACAVLGREESERLEAVYTTSRQRILEKLQELAEVT
jgi:hypothetical protein